MQSVMADLEKHPTGDERGNGIDVEEDFHGRDRRRAVRQEGCVSAVGLFQLFLESS